MRGKHTVMDRRADEDRITPADAGKTDGKRNRGCGKKDHPRGCGENRMSRECRLSDLGSPPRMRGKLLHCKLHLVYGGITPADAGKTIAAFIF